MQRRVNGGGACPMMTHDKGGARWCVVSSHDDAQKEQRRTRTCVLRQRAQEASHGALSSSLDMKEIQEHKILIFHLVRARLRACWEHVESAFEAHLREWLETR